MRRFEFRDAKSAKFWSIDLQGARFTVCFGKIGSAGQTQVKEFGDEARARKEHDKLIAEKTRKGYVEIPTEETFSAAPPGTALRTALESAIFAHPDDLASHMAHADFLSEQGDPLGEFIRTQLALEDPRNANRDDLRQREQQLLAAHGPHWLGDLAPYLIGSPEQREALGVMGWLTRPEYFQFHLIRGWLAFLNVAHFDPQLAAALVACPRVHLLRELVIRRVGWDDPGIAELAAIPTLPHLRRFQLGDSEDQCHINAEALLPVIARMPGLEALELYAHGVPTHELFAHPLPHLRLLKVYHLREYPLEVLGANPTLGKLEILECWPHMLEPGDDAAYIQFENFQGLVQSPHLTRLRSLSLFQSDIGDEGCRALVESGFLKHLKVLDLTNGTISDEGARILAACPDLKHLERLCLAANQLTAEGIAVLQATGVPLTAPRQHTAQGITNLDYLAEGDME
jgi:uncharacterized protein (TIGR02996 family)